MTPVSYPMPLFRPASSLLMTLAVELDMNGEICRRLPLDPSLLCLAPEEVAFFQECAGIQSEEKLFAHIQGIAIAAYDVRTCRCAASRILSTLTPLLPHSGLGSSKLTAFKYLL